MTTFAHPLDLLRTIPDPCRAQGRMYALPHLVLFAILAVVAGANSYRGIHSFIDVHLDRLKAAFGLGWRRAPAYTSIRLVLQSLDASELERVFRIHAAVLADQIYCEGVGVVAFDGKTLRGSFDHFADRAAIHLVSAFDAAAAMRGHWGIENRAHHVRDVTMAEDASRVRKTPAFWPASGPSPPTSCVSTAQKTSGTPDIDLPSAGSILS